MERGPRHGERVFRAAVSAYSSLPHPAREDAARLDDLAMGLYDSAPIETRRFAAAVLSDCDPAPRLLIRRLAGESVDIAAPVLMRSKALSDVDLISLIARNGISHARAIARREALHPAVAALTRALLRHAEPEPGPNAPEEMLKHVEQEPALHPVSQNEEMVHLHNSELGGDTADQAQSSIEAMRNELRNLMNVGATAKPGLQPIPPHQSSVEAYQALREGALSGEMRRFAEALSTALQLPIPRTRALVSAATYSDLLTALKSLDLSTEQALLLTLTAYPAQVASPAAIRLFCVRYEAFSLEIAREKIRDWQSEDNRERSQDKAAAPAGKPEPILEKQNP